VEAADRLIELAEGRARPDSGWAGEVEAAVAFRPPEWNEISSPPGSPIHAIEVAHAVQQVLDRRPDSVYVSDGGEFGQWVQAGLSAPVRLVNGPAGAIGSGIPFALAARLAYPDSIVITHVGDGTFGFHAMEFDTAVRYGLPFVAVVGNDAAWNAEYQLQLREFGEDRVSETELLPTRYDRVAQSLGGHGEHVTSAKELWPAIERAIASGRPACVNIDLARVPAPRVRRPSSAAG
jgi:acetolactate synthase-1/2/3 large subunit